MKKTNAITLVLRGIRKAGNSLDTREQRGSGAMGQNPAVTLPVFGRLSHGPRIDCAPGMRRAYAENFGMVRYAPRAGRLADPAVLLHRLAITARQTILSRWSLAKGQPNPLSCWCGVSATPAPAGEGGPKHPRGFSCDTLPERGCGSRQDERSAAPAKA